MSKRLLNPFTVLIAPSGKTPITLFVKPAYVLALLAGVLSIPLVIVYSLYQQNQVLTQKNTVLTKAASEVFEQVDTLDAELEDLRERAGLPEKKKEYVESQTPSSQGGTAIKLAPEILFKLAGTRLPLLSSDLEQQVKPALEETLDFEAALDAATPKGQPLKIGAQVSSEFGLRRNPFGGGYEFHNGIDLKGAYGTPIYATGTGKVERAEFSRGYGYHVVVDHDYGYRTLYAHMSEMAVADGDQIQRGQLIGYIGSTGRSSGPHLHYSIYHQGSTVDPKGYMGLLDSTKFFSNTGG
ncbi:MAG: M23 family metallopeptidase [Cyanothece sp. SIO1E1]|nr:M23 family metallopeptidase [Cyanothece sp. SIO1E1]